MFAHVLQWWIIVLIWDAASVSGWFQMPLRIMGHPHVCTMDLLLQTAELMAVHLSADDTLGVKGQAFTGSTDLMAADECRWGGGDIHPQNRPITEICSQTHELTAVTFSDLSWSFCPTWAFKRKQKSHIKHPPPPHPPPPSSSVASRSAADVSRASPGG